MTQDAETQKINAIFLSKSDKELLAKRYGEIPQGVVCIDLRRDAFPECLLPYKDRIEDHTLILIKSVTSCLRLEVSEVNAGMRRFALRPIALSDFIHEISDTLGKRPLLYSVLGEQPPHIEHTAPGSIVVMHAKRQQVLAHYMTLLAKEAESRHENMLSFLVSALPSLFHARPSFGYNDGKETHLLKTPSPLKEQKWMHAEDFFYLLACETQRELGLFFKEVFQGISIKYYPLTKREWDKIGQVFEEKLFKEILFKLDVSAVLTFVAQSQYVIPRLKRQNVLATLEPLLAMASAERMKPARLDALRDVFAALIAQGVIADTTHSDVGKLCYVMDLVLLHAAKRNGQEEAEKHVKARLMDNRYARRVSLDEALQQVPMEIMTRSVPAHLNYILVPFLVPVLKKELTEPLLIEASKDLRYFSMIKEAVLKCPLSSETLIAISKNLIDAHISDRALMAFIANVSFSHRENVRTEMVGLLLGYIEKTGAHESFETVFRKYRTHLPVESSLLRQGMRTLFSPLVKPSTFTKEHPFSRALLACAKKPAKEPGYMRTFLKENLDYFEEAVQKSLQERERAEDAKQPEKSRSWSARIEEKPHLTKASVYTVQIESISRSGSFPT